MSRVPQSKQKFLCELGSPTHSNIYLYINKIKKFKITNGRKVFDKLMNLTYLRLAERLLIMYVMSLA